MQVPSAGVTQSSEFFGIRVEGLQFSAGFRIEVHFVLASVLSSHDRRLTNELSGYIQGDL